MATIGFDRRPRQSASMSRVLGILAAVGFSLAMWVFLAMAAIGLVMKIMG